MYIISLLNILHVAGIGSDAHLTFDPLSEVLGHLISELNFLSEGEVTTVLHQLDRRETHQSVLYTCTYVYNLEKF